MLKQEVADLNQRVRRQEVPPEYLKEVVVRYILSSPVSMFVSCAMLVGLFCYANRSLLLC